MSTINRERAAKAVVDAAVLGDPEAAKKYGVSTKSIERWRLRVATDPKLSALVQELREAQKQSWANEIPEALSACIEFVKSASQIANKTDPNAIAAIVQAIETLSDVALTWKMIDERAKAARSEAEAA